MLRLHKEGGVAFFKIFILPSYKLVPFSWVIRHWIHLQMVALSSSAIVSTITFRLKRLLNKLDCLVFDRLWMVTGIITATDFLQKAMWRWPEVLGTSNNAGSEDSPFLKIFLSKVSHKIEKTEVVILDRTWRSKKYWVYTIST